MNLKELGTDGNVTEANLIKAKLEPFGIEAMVQADVMTDSIPTLEWVHGVKVLVKEEDLGDAYEVLERMLPAGGQPDDPQ